MTYKFDIKAHESSHVREGISAKKRILIKKYCNGTAGSRSRTLDHSSPRSGALSTVPQKHASAAESISALINPGSLQYVLRSKGSPVKS